VGASASLNPQSLSRPVQGLLYLCFALQCQDIRCSLINGIVTAMNNKQIVGGIFCDLHKAFDTVQHNILLDKLKFYGIVGKFYSLIESYLYNRYQKYHSRKLSITRFHRNRKNLIVECRKAQFLVLFFFFCSI
jgi:hypothetical protein